VRRIDASSAISAPAFNGALLRFSAASHYVALMGEINLLPPSKGSTAAQLAYLLFGAYAHLWRCLKHYPNKDALG
jgi:hypothetical protein